MLLGYAQQLESKFTTLHNTLLSRVYLEETWFGWHSWCDKSDNVYYAHDTLHFTLDTNAYPVHIFVSSLLFIMNQTVANQFNFCLSNNLNSRQIRIKCNIVIVQMGNVSHKT